METQIEDFHFASNFDSGNLARVEKVCGGQDSIQEFNLWTSPDAAGTPFQNGNRTWFYFSLKGPAGAKVKLNLMNLNKQAKLYSQGMRPLYKIVPTQTVWERIPDKPTYTMDDNNFTLSFAFTLPSDPAASVLFAFCFPYSYSELQRDLDNLDRTYLNHQNIYYTRDLLCRSLEGKRVDILTITSKGDEDKPKPVVLISARVHPGETPSSFVLRGSLNFLLSEDDPRAAKAREQFIFKIIPMLNPDGVYRGHYRTDSRGVNLNRYYLETSSQHHPTIAAVKQLVLSFQSDDSSICESSLSGLEHQVKDSLIMESTETPFGSIRSAPVPVKDEDSSCQDTASVSSFLSPGPAENQPRLTSFAGIRFGPSGAVVASPGKNTESKVSDTLLETSAIESPEDADVSISNFCEASSSRPCPKTSSKKTRLFAYIDLHGHASKRGIFIYGNHFRDSDSQVECMLLPKLLSLNSEHFDFWACNFTEKNMYLKDKRDGLSKEGSGRVAVFKLTSLIRSYTLECNYNMGRMRNILVPLSVKDKPQSAVATTDDVLTEKGTCMDSIVQRRRTVSASAGCSGAREGFLPAVHYTVEMFEEVGQALVVSLLDLVEENPVSRLPSTCHRNVSGVRTWLRNHCLGQRQFDLVNADLDEEINHSTSKSGSSSNPDQVSSTAAASGRGESSTSPRKKSAVRPRVLGSPVRRTRLNSTSSKCDEVKRRTRAPWPSTSRAESSPASPPLHFPKQPKSPLHPPKIRRRKLLKSKSKLPAKREVETDTAEASAAGSPPPQLKSLKRKRRKSKSLPDCKGKRKFKATVAEGAEFDDVAVASTSTSSGKTASSPKSLALPKKGKILKKRLGSKKKA